MKQAIYIVTCFLLASCGEQKSEETTISVVDTTAIGNEIHNQQNVTVDQKKNPTDRIAKKVSLLCHLGYSSLKKMKKTWRKLV